MRMGVMRALCRKEDDIEPFTREARLAGSLAQHALATVPKDRISQSLRRNEGDSCWAAFVES